MISFQQNSLTVFQSALFQTTSTVIEGEGFVLVADPTWLPHEVAEIAGFVAQVRRGRALYLLLTHSDFDHILGAGEFPDATVIASRAFADNPAKEQAVQKVRAWDSEYYIKRPYGVRYPQVDIAAIADGQELALGLARLTFYQAPGHNPDGLLTVVEPHGVLIAGDYLSDIEFPFIYQSSTAYEGTLAKLDGILARHALRVLVPGHGQVTTDTQEMQQRQRQSLDYIRTLRGLIAAGNQEAIDAMPTRYAFPLGMAAFHQGNERLLRAEAQAVPSRAR